MKIFQNGISGPGSLWLHSLGFMSFIKLDDLYVFTPLNLMASLVTCMTII